METAYSDLLSTLTGIPIQKIETPVSISKLDIFKSWLTDDPLVRKDHETRIDCMCEQCFQRKSNYMSTIQLEAPFAIATAQAKEEGHEDFSDGSSGEKRRSEIAEAIKYSNK